MPSHAVQLHPPRDEQVFEDLRLDLFSALWGTAQLYGRSGHKQKGIDLYGKVGNEHVAVQCKKREGKLTKADVEKDTLVQNRFRKKTLFLSAGCAVGHRLWRCEVSRGQA